MINEKINKIIFQYQTENNYTNSISFENQSGVVSIGKIPQFSPSSKVIVVTETGKRYETKFKNFASLFTGDIGRLSVEEKKDLEIFLDGQNFNYSIDIPGVSSMKTPEIKITDITETILLGFPPLPMEAIDGNGIWSWHGMRVFNIKVENLLFTDSYIRPDISFNKIDNREICDINASASIRIRKDNAGEFFCYLNTNKLGEIIDSQQEKKHIYSFEGAFTIKKKNISQPDIIETYEFPFSIKVNNSKLFDPNNKNICINKNARVSIDFGTSSTCAAIDSSRISLIEMTPDYFGKNEYNVYENPTNLRIFKWENILEHWIENDMNHPVLYKEENGSGKYFDFSDAVFDYGHSVKENKKNDKRTLESIITELKMIPGNIADGGDPFCVPYHADSIRNIHLVCGEENDTHFDPVAFYGYLLGCAVNHPNGNDNQFYTRYSLTFPVRFNNEIREKLRCSLEKGILRSLPAGADELADKKGNKLFKVDMSYAEPVACVGAVCRHELKINNDVPEIFGIFDFGGGTIDFSFGMYRNPDEDEDENEVIELFGTDGNEKFGGELLIKKISYWILTTPSNNDVIKQYRIMFEKPSDESIPDGYSQFINSSASAISNMRVIGEKISRAYFEKREEIKDGLCKFNVDELSSDDGFIQDEVGLNIDYGEIKAKLEKEIENICSVFENSMENSFNKEYAVNEMLKYGYEFNPGTFKSNIRIIMSGNAAKHPMVKECLSKRFTNVALVGEDKNRDNSVKRYAVTPKTAVAIGALKLRDMLVKMPSDISGGDMVVFQWYVAVDEKGKKKILISRNSSDSVWYRAGKVKENEVKIYFGRIFDVNNEEVWTASVLDFDDTYEGKICFIRASGTDSIEYIAVDRNTDPNLSDDYEIIDNIELRQR